MQKYNVIIRFHHFGRQAIIILCSLWLICPLPVLWLGAIIAILRKVNTVFIDFHQIQTDDIGRLVLCHDKTLMDHHGSQGKEIGFAHNISFLKRNPIYLVIQTMCLPFTQK